MGAMGPTTTTTTTKTSRSSSPTSETRDARVAVSSPRSLRPFDCSEPQFARSLAFSRFLVLLVPLLFDPPFFLYFYLTHFNFLLPKNLILSHSFRQHRMLAPVRHAYTLLPCRHCSIFSFKNSTKILLQKSFLRIFLPTLQIIFLFFHIFSFYKVVGRCRARSRAGPD